MAWTIEFDEAAIRRLRKMPAQDAKRIRDFMRDRIATLPDPRQDERLVVLVVEIGHRREVYR